MFRPWRAAHGQAGLTASATSKPCWRHSVPEKSQRPENGRHDANELGSVSLTPRFSEVADELERTQPFQRFFAEPRVPPFIVHWQLRANILSSDAQCSRLPSCPNGPNAACYPYENRKCSTTAAEMG